MSIPAFGWAIEQGRARNLPSSVRLVLIALANWVKGDEAWPCQETLRADTGLTIRTIHEAVRRLQKEKLIEVCRRGKSRTYRFLRDVNGADGEPNEHRKPLPVKVRTPETIAGETVEAVAGVEAEHRKSTHEHRKLLPKTPETISTNPLSDPSKTQGRKNLRSARATLPADWSPNEQVIVFGCSVGLSRAEIAFEADRMRDWAAAKGEACHDWDARFRNWLRREATDRNRANRRVPPKAVHDQIRDDWQLTSFLTPQFDDDKPPPGRLLS